MMYVIFNNDGSIKYKQLNTFVQKGNSYVDELFVAIDGRSPETYTLVLQPTLPDGTSATALTGQSASLTLDGIPTYSGSKYSFPNTITAQEGKLTINIVATDLNDHTLVTSNVFVTVNPSGVISDDPVYLDYAEWQQLISGLGQYALKFSERTIRKYADSTSANNDLSNLVEGQVVAVKVSGKYQLYEKITTGGVSSLTAVDLPYVRLDGTTAMTGDLNMGSHNISSLQTPTNPDHATNKIYVDSNFIKNADGVHKTGGLTENIDGIKTFTSGLPKAKGSDFFTVTNDEDLVYKKYIVDNYQAKLTAGDGIDITNNEVSVDDDVARLDANGKLLTSQIPEAILGQLKYKGVWDASVQATGVTPSKGDYYICQVAGGYNPDGTTHSGSSYNIGDWAVYNGTTWDKIDNTDAVSSVNGMTGEVVLNGSNVYYQAGSTQPIKVVLDSKSSVSVSDTGTATDEVKYITIDGVEKKIGGDGAVYTAGEGIDITDNEISIDTDVVATQTDLESKQDTLTEGTGIDITNNTISVDTDVIASKSYVADTYNNASFSSLGDNANITFTKKDATTQNVNISLATNSNAGLMSASDVNAITNLTSRVESLEGQTIRLLYESTIPATASTIATFIQQKGYTDPTQWTSIAVVEKLNNHIWKFVNSLSISGTWVFKDVLGDYPQQILIREHLNATFTSNSNNYRALFLTGNDPELRYVGVDEPQVLPTGTLIYDFETDTWSDNAYKTIEFSVFSNCSSSMLNWLVNNTVTRGTYSFGSWTDFGLDTVTQFTNSSAGVIKGSTTNGKVYAENDGTGSLVGYDGLVNSFAENYDSTQTYVAGDYAMHDGVLKKYDGTTWTTVNVAGAKQDTLTSGTNIKTINNNSILGSGDITISAGTTVESAEYSENNTALEGITIGGTTYRLLPLGSGASTNCVEIGRGSVCNSNYQEVAIGNDASTYQYGVAIGYYAEQKGSGVAIGRVAKSGSSSVAIGNGATTKDNTQTYNYQAVAIGCNAKATGHNTVAVGYGAVNDLPNSATFDTGSSTMTYHCRDGNYIFFRNQNNNSSYYDKTSYTTGYSLAERLNGLAITDNSVTEIDYDKTLIQTLSANVTWTFKAVPSSTGTNLSCKPEYKAVLTTSSAITVTLPSANTYLLKTNDTNITLATNVLSLPISANGIEINIKQIGSNFVILAMNWSV